MVKAEDVKLEISLEDGEEGHSDDQKPKVELRDERAKSEYSGTHTPLESSSSSSTSSPRPFKKTRARKESPPPFKPTLITHLPNADAEARETYVDLERCLYEKKYLGLSNQQEEMMVCDCVHEKGSHESTCGPHSDCINRLTQVECLAAECRGEQYCANQRFANRQYADIEVVQTEMKGFGLRARRNIANDSFIYEYIGEVVTEPTFMKRMSKYADEGIKHFYFMMLQKEEYIDATKKGGIGRFANHSCNPNCYVAKWVVGKRMRMGIFSKRDVLEGEELTFNYNVDRYGHDAQICYCGEPNCVGTIGGKTQTDLGGMDDLFLDALGITDAVEALGLKGNRKRKGRKLDEDFMPEMHPIEEHEVAKVVAAVRQSNTNRLMAVRLLQRINMTDDSNVQQRMMRMHGFSLMHTVLLEYEEDSEIVTQILECLTKWKLSFKNKIEDSKISSPVENFLTSEDETIRNLATQLLEYWEALPHSYRIPRREKIANLDADDEAATSTINDIDSAIAHAHRADDAWERASAPTLQLAPVVFRPPVMRPKPNAAHTPVKPQLLSTPSNDRSRLDAIIALAAQTVQAAAAVPVTVAGPSNEPGTPRKEREEDDEEERERDRRKRAKRSAEQKERRLVKMVGEVVVRSMSKYREQMEHETFKRYAKECTNVLVEKEKKSASYSSSDRLDAFSEEKKAKMKSFTKEYAHKVLKKLKEKGKLRKIPSDPRKRQSNATPTTPATADAAHAQSEDQLVTDIFGGEDGIDEDPSPPVPMTPDGSPPPLATYDETAAWRKDSNSVAAVLLAATPGTPATPDVEVQMDINMNGEQ